MKARLIEKWVRVQAIDHQATGELMRNLRKSKGVSLRVFAKRMGFSAQFLSDLERGNRNWTNRLIERWREAAK